MLNKYPLLYVEWEDHSAEGGWSHEEDEIVDTALCASVGWLFKETTNSIILISSLCEDTHQVGNKQIIARKLIHATRILRKPRNRKQAATPAELGVHAAIIDSGLCGGPMPGESGLHGGAASDEGTAAKSPKGCG